jgi:hypothetical protein
VVSEGRKVRDFWKVRGRCMGGFLYVVFVKSLVLMFLKYKYYRWIELHSVVPTRIGFSADVVALECVL